MIIRKGTQADLVSVEQLYNDIHTAEETGQQTIGWIRGVYPTRATAQAALVSIRSSGQPWLKA